MVLTSAERLAKRKATTCGVVMRVAYRVTQIQCVIGRVGCGAGRRRQLNKQSSFVFWAFFLEKSPIKSAKLRKIAHSLLFPHTRIMAWTVSAPLLLVGAVAAVADPCIKPGVRPQPFHLSLWRVFAQNKRATGVPNMHTLMCTRHHLLSQTTRTHALAASLAWRRSAPLTRQ
jgi:hypothetical protein